MTITTKTNANGRIIGYYVDGEKVRKNEIDGIINARRDEIIYVDYFVGQEFRMLTSSFIRQLKVVFTNYDQTVMTQAAADELGYSVIIKWFGDYSNTFLVEKKNDAEVEREEILSTPLVTLEAMQEAINAEIKLATVETATDAPADEDNDDDNVFDLLPSVDELNDVEGFDVELVLPKCEFKEDIWFSRTGIEYCFIRGDAELVVYTNGELFKIISFRLQAGWKTDKFFLIGNYLEEKTVSDDEFFEAMKKRGVYMVDEFAEKLAKLQAEKDAAFEALAAAEDKFTRANRELEEFMNDTASKLSAKLQTLKPQGKITIISQSGGRSFKPADFDDVYIDAEFDKFAFNDWRGRSYAGYDTPAQIEAVIKELAAAIERGDKEFTFPTVDELNNPPEMPPCAPKSPDINAEDNLPANDEIPPKNAFDAQIALVNKTAPVGWHISFDTDQNNFPVKFHDKTITTLDSLALTKFLTPEQFFEQFKPLVDKNFSPKQQFIADRQEELAALQDMRKLIIDDAERLKSIDDMIDAIKRDLLEIALE